MNTTKELLLEEQERLRKELKKAFQNSRNIRMYEELQSKASKFNNIKDTQQCLESYHDAADYMKHCNDNFIREGIGAYYDAVQTFDEMGQTRVKAYENSMQNVDMEDSGLEQQAFLDEVPHNDTPADFREGNMKKITVQTQTVEQNRPMTSSELLKSQQEMQKELEKCAQQSAKEGIQIEIENKMPNGDIYKFAFKPVRKSNGVRSSKCTLTCNGKVLGSGRVKDVVNRYSKEVMKKTQKAVQKLVKIAVKVAQKAANKATKNTANVAVQTTKVATNVAANSNPYSSITKAAKEAVAQEMKITMKVVEKGIKIMKNEKILDMTER